MSTAVRFQPNREMPNSDGPTAIVSPSRQGVVVHCSIPSQLASNSALNGLMDEFVLTNYAMGPAEITQLMNGVIEPPPIP